MDEFRGGTKRIFLVATRADYEPVVSTVEKQRPLRYLRYEQVADPELPVAASAIDLPSLGRAATGSHGTEPMYLITHDDGIPVVRQIRRKSGTTVYQPDYHYPAAVWANWGGLFDGVYRRPRSSPEERAANRAELNALFPKITPYYSPVVEPEIDPKPVKCLIYGEIYSNSTHPDGLELMKLCRKEARKRFVRRSEYWVGPEAAELLDAGVPCGVSAMGGWFTGMTGRS